MKRLTFPAIVMVVILSSQPVLAQVPQKFNYQAVVRGNAGIVMANKALGLRFSIRDGSAAGSVLYSETQLTTTNAFGLVNVQIGGGTASAGSLGSIAWGSGGKFLQVEVDTTGSANYVELATVELIAVPYALRAAGAGLADSSGVAGKAGKASLADSAGVAGKAGKATLADSSGKANFANTAVAANTAVSASSAGTALTAGSAVNFTGPLAGDVAGTQGATVIQNNAVTAPKIANGQIVKSINGLKDNITLSGGGGTTLTAVGNTLTINGASGTITGVNSPFIFNSGLTGGGTSGNIQLAVTYGGSGTAVTSSHSDHDHAGQFWSSAGTTLSLGTTSAGFNDFALNCIVNNNTSAGAAIFAQSPSTNAQAAAIVGQVTGAQASVGSVAGVQGIALGQNTVGILCSAQGGRYAGLFAGDVLVTGTLSKGGGSFKIDHPLDPENKYLSHSFVESPDMMNIYDGNIELDGNGGATVTMPDWFGALNRDFRYQLTAIGKPSPNVYIAEEIKGNQFRIAGGTPGGKISWMVTGIRHDAYANKHRIPVEEMKTGSERGKYLNPDAFGKSQDQSVFRIPAIHARQPAKQVSNTKAGH